MQQPWSLVVLVLLGGLSPMFAADEKRPLVPSITVSGEGKVSAKPDQAEVQVGVMTQDQTAAAALKANNQAMEKLLVVLKKHELADKDVQTSNFHVSPMYRNDPQGRRQPEVVGYQVNNQVRVKVRLLDKLGTVLDAVVAEGANQVHGVSFSLADPQRVLDDARRKAMADARRKAELYAKEAGAKAGKVLLIQEQSFDLPRPQFFGRVAEAQTAAVPIATGEQDFQASITVTYALE